MQSKNKSETKALKQKQKNQSAGCGFCYWTTGQLSLEKNQINANNFLHSVLILQAAGFQMRIKRLWLVSSGQLILNSYCIQWDRCCYSANINLLPDLLFKQPTVGCQQIHVFSFSSFPCIVAMFGVFCFAKRHNVLPDVEHCVTLFSLWANIIIKLSYEPQLFSATC